MPAILVSLIVALLRSGLFAALGWLAAKNYIDSQQSATITAFCESHFVQVALFAVGLISALGWKFWSWFTHFQIVQSAQKLIGVNATGIANKDTVEALKTLADAVPKQYTTPGTSAGNKVALIGLLLLPAVLLGGCNAARENFDSVSAYGGYTDDKGDSYKGGVSLGIRPPDPVKNAK